MQSNRNKLELQNDLSSDRQVVKVNNDSTGLLLKDNKVFVEEQPTEDNEVATKKYVDDNSGGGASSLNDLSDVSVSGSNVSLTGANELTFGAQGVTVTSADNIILDATVDIEINADGGDITLKDGSTELARVKTGGIKLPNANGILFGTEETDKFHGDGTDLFIAKDDSDVWTFLDDQTQTEIPLKIRESSSAVADTAAFGQLWVKNDTPNNLYFTNDAGNDVQITNGSSLASGGGGAKTFMDWYYYSANLATLNNFYVSTHHDEFGVTNIINSNISDYNDTTGEDMWRTIRYGGRRIPYSGTITKFMAHVDSSGASADSVVEVGVWKIDKPTLDTVLGSTTNVTMDNLGLMTFTFDSASAFLHKETTSFNATSVTQGDFMFVTVRRTNGSDGSSFYIHSTIAMDIS